MSNTYNTKQTNITLPNNYTISGFNGYSVTTASSVNVSSFNSSNQTPVMTIPHGQDKVILEKKATFEVKGNVVINGLDLEERLKTIEQVLMIPERDATLEAKYPSLKKKFDEYIKELSKTRMWESLKGEN
jgi:hypothetical protein